ncbi:MAG: RNA polymerase sigma factor [Armatimonadota bacterium]
MAVAASAPWVPEGAGLPGEAGWEYNRWLGRWRRRSAPAADAREPAAGDEAIPRDAEGDSPMPFDESDKTLVERVKAGDVRAFEMLHRRYYPRIYRFAMMRLGSAEDAADVACNVFLRALKHLPSYQFTRANTIYPWLHQIASNLVIDLVRARPAGKVLSLDAQAAEDLDSFLEFLPDDGPSPQELVERSEVQALVRQAIEQLPADQARAVSLRYLADLSIREIAQALDRSEGAVKSLLHRALQGMKGHLKSVIAAARSNDASATLRGEAGVDSHESEVLHLRSRDA